MPYFHNKYNLLSSLLNQPLGLQISNRIVNLCPSAIIDMNGVYNNIPGYNHFFQTFMKEFLEASEYFR